MSGRGSGSMNVLSRILIQSSLHLIAWRATHTLKRAARSQHRRPTAISLSQLSSNCQLILVHDTYHTTSNWTPFGIKLLKHKSPPNSLRKWLGKEISNHLHIMVNAPPHTYNNIPSLTIPHPHLTSHIIARP